MNVKIDIHFKEKHFILYSIFLIILSIIYATHIANADLVDSITYTLLTYVIGLLLSLVPVAGPVILWMYILPSLSSYLGLENTLIIDIFVMIPCIIINAVITFLIILLLIALIND